MGFTGPTGLMGPTGIIGKGPVGLTGPAGLNGSTGPTGTSDFVLSNINGLFVNYTSGNVCIEDTTINVPSGILTLPANSTNFYIYYDYYNNIITSGPNYDILDIPIAIFSTNKTAIILLTNIKILCNPVLSFYKIEYGYGILGNIVLDGILSFSFCSLNNKIYTLNTDVFFNSLIINQNIILDTNCFRVFVKILLCMNNGSKICNNGENAINNIGGIIQQINTLGNGSAGGNGGNNASGCNSIALQNSLGGIGGIGGSINNTTIIPGTPGIITVPTPNNGGIYCLGTIPNCLTCSTLGNNMVFGGSGGYGGCSANIKCFGGAGGAGGNICMISARNICVNGSASICANGGNGSNAYNTQGYNYIGSGGGGGGGGCCVVITNSRSKKINNYRIINNC